jgi:hypothetical protein
VSGVSNIANRQLLKAATWGWLEVAIAERYGVVDKPYVARAFNSPQKALIMADFEQYEISLAAQDVARGYVEIPAEIAPQGQTRRVGINLMHRSRQVDEVISVPVPPGMGNI